MRQPPGADMASRIQTPILSSTTPPYFSMDIGYAAKVIADGDATWVKVIDIRDDNFLGIVLSTQSDRPAPILREHDVIEFTREHIFGMY